MNAPKDPELLAAFRDAERWRYARRFLAIEDVERWPKEMRGHRPDEVESVKADEAIDRLMLKDMGFEPAD